MQQGSPRSAYEATLYKMQTVLLPISLRRLPGTTPLWVCLATTLFLTGCAGPVPPARQAPSDYRSFVEAWMGALPRKLYANPVRGMPSETRVMQLDAQAVVDQRLRALSSEFNRWCRSFGATPVARDDDLQKPGDSMLVCEGASGNRFGVFSGVTDAEAAKQGRRELLLKHWYGGAIADYLLDYQQTTERRAAEREERHRQQQAEKARAAAASAASALERQQARQAAAQLPPVPGCRNFERQSNALRARFDAPVEREPFARYLSDLVVALDECVHARPAPADRLVAVYRFNLASFQLFGRAWLEGLLPCGERGECHANAPMFTGQMQQVALLQAEYPALDATVPSKPIGLIDRVVRFMLDR